MSWRERDYELYPDGQPAYRDRVGTWREFLPPAATRVLVILHVVGFIATVSYRESMPPLRFDLNALDPNPLAILTHPFATPSALSELFVVILVWTLAGRVETNLGPRRMLALYLLGNFFAGLAYFGLVARWGGLAAAPLDTPLGAMVAWSLAIWRNTPFEQVSVFGFMMTLASAMAWLGGISLVFAVIRFGPGATAWTIAGCIGGAISPILDALAEWRAARASHASPQPEPQPRRKPPRQPFARKTPEPPPDDIPIDDILAKISRDGVSSLTPDERERLERARKAKLQRDASTGPSEPL